MKTIPKTLSGFMELYPQEQLSFEKLKNIIIDTYKSYGFYPLDTPVIEYSEVLLAKAGGETEKQIYRFNKGDNDLSLRFDLTVPLAKYVSMRSNELVFPFKRYQVGKVFRGERPQKGRFREFYQCDIDVIAEDELSLKYDSEIINIIYDIFSKLNIASFTIRINNRKILNGFFKYLNLDNKITEILRVIDKLDKIGVDNVKEELSKLDISNDKITEILNFITLNGRNDEILRVLKEKYNYNELINEGINEIEEVLNDLESRSIPTDNYKFDLTIARGLDYYTGTVYETYLNDYESIGSVCSGGRYENLAEYYTDKKLPGVGASIGLTRLFSKLLETNLIKIDDMSSSDIMIVPLCDNYKYIYEINSILKSQNISVNICYLNKGIKQRMKYANKMKNKYIILIGEDEVNKNTIILKNMISGDQIEIEKNNLLNIEKIIE